MISQKHKFTLIELLVVIAIIGILASLLMPVLSKTRAKGRAAVCKSNLKQWGMASFMYTDNWDGTMPHIGLDGMRSIFKEIAEMSGEVRYCPSDGLAQNKTSRNANGILWSYGYNGYFTTLDISGQGPVKISAVQYPSNTLIFIDRAHKGEVDFYDQVYGVSPSTTEKSRSAFAHKHKAFTRHNTKYSNMVQIDGSVNSGLSILYRTPSGWDNTYRRAHFMIYKDPDEFAQALAEIQ
ncbi:prepilin-type N-terminal cleavage/methylation domain-containing protein [Lentisphaera profundi]|uniref:Prepilin-type N-terminal cleavage/methylation domain-containing protein n=1 Tax=Lentisphaera profundi TaxID=1658616 RepID=A0ABY7VSU8_9BACT|nr:prepilin-type N-terminal cleavage/methylation domain-containing protein [Lentisphaera profundi]WDE97281.1 prepilin-type N-terminal cleavage/methylation domain-containing protein [Lentisphaera profundi]